MGYEVRNGDIDRYHRIKRRKLYAGTPSQSDDSHPSLSIPSSSADILPLNQYSAKELESQQDQGQVEVSSQTDLVSITDLERDNQSLRSYK